MKLKTEKTNEEKYGHALDFLYGFIDFEKSRIHSSDDIMFDLSRMKELVKRLGHPENSFASVHVAGTNGKGTTCAVIDSILRQAGYHVGLYTSPHLISFRERIRTNGVNISEEQVVQEVEKLKPFTGELEKLSFFEVWTALAFSFFYEEQIEIAVLETGMGGRFDATNVVKPVLSVITPVDLDHTQRLGVSRNQILAEKAGIIKAGSPVISAEQMDDGVELLKKIAQGSGTELYLFGQNFYLNSVKMFPEGVSFNIEGIFGTFKNLFMPLVGKHQAVNAVLAVASVELLAEKGFSIKKEHIIRGLETIEWPGRLQTLQKKPELIVDTACNVSAASAVCSYIDSIKENRSLHLIFGISDDKDSNGVFSLLAELADEVTLTMAKNPRAVRPEALLDILKPSIPVKINHNVEDAVKEALASSDKNDIILVTGSIYVVGELLEFY